MPAFPLAYLPLARPARWKVRPARKDHKNTFAQTGEPTCLSRRDGRQNRGKTPDVPENTKGYRSIRPVFTATPKKPARPFPALLTPPSWTPATLPGEKHGGFLPCSCCFRSAALSGTACSPECRQPSPSLAPGKPPSFPPNGRKHPFAFAATCRSRRPLLQSVHWRVREGTNGAKTGKRGPAFPFARESPPVFRCHTPFHQPHPG